MLLAATALHIEETAEAPPHGGPATGSDLEGQAAALGVQCQRRDGAREKRAPKRPNSPPEVPGFKAIAG